MRHIFSAFQLSMRLLEGLLLGVERSLPLHSASAGHARRVEQISKRISTLGFVPGGDHDFTAVRRAERRQGFRVINACCVWRLGIGKLLEHALSDTESDATIAACDQDDRRLWPSGRISGICWLSTLLIGQNCASSTHVVKPELVMERRCLFNTCLSSHTIELIKGTRVPSTFHLSSHDAVKLTGSSLKVLPSLHERKGPTMNSQQMLPPV